MPNRIYFRHGIHFSFALRRRAESGLGVTLSDSLTYEYDEAGRLAKITFADGTIVEFTYDNMGNRVQVETTVPPP